MKKFAHWKKLALTTSILLAGAGTGFLWLYSEQLDDEHEALVRDHRFRAAHFPSTPLPIEVVTNQRTRAGEDRYSTFAVDVDTASYTQARRSITTGYLPDPTTVRVEEFVNYFDYGYPQPETAAFGVTMDGAPSPFDPTGRRKIVRIGLQGKAVSTDRKPVHLTLLVDVSGSMTSVDKLPMVKTSLHQLVNHLKPTDTIAIATYAGRTAKILEPTPVERASTILAAIDALQSGGGTAMSDGVTLAYEMAMQSFQAGHENRVIVFSDGDANIGRATPDELLATIKGYVDEGITLSTIGFGVGNYRDGMMEQFANRGNGNNFYVDSTEEATRLFGDELSSMLVTIARDVKIQVEFDPEKVIEYRLIGYENRDIADADFRDDNVDAGEVGAGHSVTALYEVTLAEDAAGVLATTRVRYEEPDGSQADELEFDLRSTDLASTLGTAPTGLQFASAVAQFAEILRGSPYASGLQLAAIAEIAASVTDDAAKREFVDLAEQAIELRARG